jgi:hypothetical protein
LFGGEALYPVRLSGTFNFEDPDEEIVWRGEMRRLEERVAGPVVVWCYDDNTHHP